MVLVGKLVVPEREDVAIGISNHGHYSEVLLGGFGDEPHPPVVQHSAVVQEPGYMKRKPGVPADQRLGVGVHGRMNAQMRRFDQELGAISTLPRHGQSEGIAIESDGAVDVGDKDRDTVKRWRWIGQLTGCYGFSGLELVS